MRHLKKIYNNEKTKVINKEFLSKNFGNNNDKMAYIDKFNKKSNLMGENKRKEKKINYSSKYYIQNNANSIKLMIFRMKNKILLFFLTFFLSELINFIFSQKIKRKKINIILQYSNIITLKLI